MTCVLSPLKSVKDAILLDNINLNIKDTLSFILNLTNKKISYKYNV
ncbi:hypothetical protein [Candidatus Phytoplasma pini]|nr:hypothetical protein [Candidatus Phytoplasma pini]